MCALSKANANLTCFLRSKELLISNHDQQRPIFSVTAITLDHDESNSRNSTNLTLQSASTSCHIATLILVIFVIMDRLTKIVGFWDPGSEEMEREEMGENGGWRVG